MTTTNRIRDILTDLERVRENLLALSDDIWLSIDHNNSQAVQRGVEFKLAYNEKMSAFDRLASDLSALVQHFTDVRVENSVSQHTESTDATANKRLIKELDKEAPHTLTEDFRYKRPFGFILQGRAFKSLVTWRRVYELVCEHLRGKDPARFAALPENPQFSTSHHNRFFARSPSQVRSASEVGEGIYAEVNLSANQIRDVICRLLAAFGVPESEMIIYLRQDRDVG
jgi:hypothetical protein